MAKKSPSATTATDLTDMTFEQAFSELEKIVDKLENGELSLEESLALHARGQQLSALCAAQLDQAELRVKEIKGDA
jgi:exodeoxyribonuclease VII small subunit